MSESRKDAATVWYAPVELLLLLCYAGQGDYVGVGAQPPCCTGVPRVSSRHPSADDRVQH